MGKFAVVLVAQLVSRHSCVADRLLVVVRFPAGPRVRLKTVDPPKGNGLGQNKRDMGKFASSMRQIGFLWNSSTQSFLRSEQGKGAVQGAVQDAVQGAVQIAVAKPGKGAVQGAV